MKPSGGDGGTGELREELGVHPEDLCPPRSCTLSPVCWGLPSSPVLDLRPSWDSCVHFYAHSCPSATAPSMLTSRALLPSTTHSTLGLHVAPTLSPGPSPGPAGTWASGGRKPPSSLWKVPVTGLTAPGSLRSRKVQGLGQLLFSHEGRGTQAFRPHPDLCPQPHGTRRCSRPHVTRTHAESGGQEPRRLQSPQSPLTGAAECLIC